VGQVLGWLPSETLQRLYVLVFFGKNIALNVEKIVQIVSPETSIDRTIEKDDS